MSTEPADPPPDLAARLRISLLEAKVERLSRRLGEVAAERDAATWELERWRDGRRRKGLAAVESVPDGLHYAAELVRAQGTEGGEGHDNLLVDAAQRLKALADASGHLLAEAIVLRGRTADAEAERDAMKPVVEAAEAWKYSGDNCDEGFLPSFSRSLQLRAAVDSYRSTQEKASGGTGE